MIVVVLSVTPEKLRGELTRWLLEISVGVYVGDLSSRVRERLWWRIIEDVGRGRALMVWSRPGEQHLDYRAHNHSWEPVDFEGITLMRRQTPEARAMARRQAEHAEGSKESLDQGATSGRTGERPPQRGWSAAGSRRRNRSAVEQRRDKRRDAETQPDNDSATTD